MNSSEIQTYCFFHHCTTTDQNVWILDQCAAGVKLDLLEGHRTWEDGDGVRKETTVMIPLLAAPAAFKHMQRNKGFTDKNNNQHADVYLLQHKNRRRWINPTLTCVSLDVFCNQRLTCRFIFLAAGSQDEFWGFFWLFKGRINVKLFLLMDSQSGAEPECGGKMKAGERWGVLMMLQSIKGGGANKVDPPSRRQ